MPTESPTNGAKPSPADPAEQSPVEDAIPVPPLAATPAAPPTVPPAQAQAASSSQSASSDDEGPAVEASAACLSGTGTEELVRRLLEQLSVEEEVGVKLAKEPLLPSFDLAGVAHLIQTGRAKRIIVMCGAGISVSAGIPDFRTPGTGLYSQLAKYNLPTPEAVFTLSYFRNNPMPFFMLAKELFPGNYLPTPTHYFLKLLHDKGLLLRCFTQNIDSLEQQAGLPADAIVAAHGNFEKAACIKCKRAHDTEHVRQAVFSDSGKLCYCLNKKCGGLVKPNIVFFGEQLPQRFYHHAELDLPSADLLIVLGTSLAVMPFAGLIHEVGPHVARLLVNREVAGDFDHGIYRDVLHLGDCDDSLRQLCQLLGWEADLDALIEEGKQQLQASDNTGTLGEQPLLDTPTTTGQAAAS